MPQATLTPPPTAKKSLEPSTNRIRSRNSIDSLSRVAPHLLPVTVLGFFVLALYWPVVGFDFVNWDDPWYVIQNPLIKSWHPANLWTIATEVAIKNYAPLTLLSYLVDHTVWGMWPGGYHLTNWLLHLVNVVLVYTLLTQLSNRRLVGWITAALFAVHPVHIETVAWISSRKGLLSAAFILASLIHWLRPNRRPRHDGYGLLFFVLALLSKAIAVVVPAVVLLYDLLVRREPLSKALPRQIIPGFFAFCLLSITMSAQTTEMGGVRDHMGFSKAHILAIDSIVVWRYVGMLVCPIDLCVLYDPPTSGIAAGVAVAVTGWLIVGWFAWRARRRNPMLLLATATFFLFLLPVLNLFPISTLMNDRYLYLPSIPFFALLAAGLVRLGRQTCEADERLIRAATISKLRLAMVAVFVGAMLLTYAAETSKQLPVWRNGLSLWSHTAVEVPQLPVVQIQLANTLQSVGRDAEAVDILKAARANPRTDEHDRKRIEAKLAAWQ